MHSLAFVRVLKQLMLFLLLCQLFLNHYLLKSVSIVVLLIILKPLIQRVMLWYKLYHIGVRCKLLQVIKSMYANVTTCVQVDGFNYFTKN
jgi:hypothetical protein